MPLEDYPIGLIPARFRGGPSRPGATTPPQAAASRPAPEPAPPLPAPPSEPRSQPAPSAVAETAAAAPSPEPAVPTAAAAMAAASPSGEGPAAPHAATRSDVGRNVDRERHRRVCDALELHCMCRNARCRRAGCCRGEPERCLATKLRTASSAVRNLANRMIQEQRLGADVDEAIEDDLEVYLAWTAGLMAARESGPA